jgi:membrane fusion protein (multidrug efflux system)
MDSQKAEIDRRQVMSPIDGVVSRTFVGAGEYASAGQRVALMHDPQRIWIEARFRETDIRRLSAGQPVHVTVDAYPDEKFEGKIERIGHAATSEFALLPTPNPTGNFTKVTQRLPVRIAIQQRDGRLRPGMMVEVYVDLR